MKAVLINLIKTMAYFGINSARKIVFFICRIFPIKGTRVFVNAFDGRGIGDNPKYIILELLKQNKKAEIIWVYRGKSKEPYRNVMYCYPFSIKAIYYQATSKIWISTVRLPYYSIKRKNQYYFQTWHGGLAFKKVENECAPALSSRYIRTAKHDAKMIDYYISDCDDNTSLFLNSFWYQKGEILKVGSPRNDIFYTCTDEDLSRLKSKYGFSNYKIAVYAPTFRKDNKLDVYDIDFKRLLKNLEKKFGGEWIILVRLHPRLAKKAEAFITYNNKVRNGSNIADIQELLVITDFLITDYSSIVFDYINTRRLALLYAPDIEEYKKDRDFHIKLEDAPFTICTNNDELEKQLLEFDSDCYKDRIDDFIKKCGFYGNGYSSIKVANKINSLLLRS
jgi:CDP-glycerol glycerophosphotransferase